MGRGPHRGAAWTEGQGWASPSASCPKGPYMTPERGRLQATCMATRHRTRGLTLTQLSRAGQSTAARPPPSLIQQPLEQDTTPGFCLHWGDLTPRAGPALPPSEFCLHWGDPSPRAGPALPHSQFCLHWGDFTPRAGPTLPLSEFCLHWGDPSPSAGRTAPLPRKQLLRGCGAHSGPLCLQTCGLPWGSPH